MNGREIWLRLSFPETAAILPNQIVAQSGSIGVGNVIARRYTQNGYNHIYLYTVNVIAGHYQAKTYITTSPSLYGHLKWDATNYGQPVGYTSLGINESGYCFIEEVEQFNIGNEKYQYLNAHAPFISGVQAGLGRTVTVGTAFVYDGNQQFLWLYNVTLANILNEIYTPKVIMVITAKYLALMTNIRLAIDMNMLPITSLSEADSTCRKR